MAKRQKRWTDSSNITDAWRISGNGTELPRLHTDRLNLVRKSYGDTIRDKPVARMSEQQVYSIARNIWSGARDFLDEQGLDTSERSILATLTRYEDALAQRHQNRPLGRNALGMNQLRSLDDDIESAEERAAIQLEGCNIPESSRIYTEYERIRSTYDRN
jgi:hypothetical protein